MPHPADATVKETRPEFRFGEGKVRGVLAVILGWLGLGAVAALHWPQYFSTPEMRTSFPMGVSAC